MEPWKRISELFAMILLVPYALVMGILTYIDWYWYDDGGLPPRKC
jgi:hypothetical protein